jgi:hypothetical protein
MPIVVNVVSKRNGQWFHQAGGGHQIKELMAQTFTLDR